MSRRILSENILTHHIIAPNFMRELNYIAERASTTEVAARPSLGCFCAAVVR